MGYDSKELLFTRFMKNPPAMDDNVGSLFKMFGGGTYQPSSAYLAVFPEEDPRYEVTFDSLEFTNLNGEKYKRQNLEEALCIHRRLSDVLYACSSDVPDQGGKRCYGPTVCERRGGCPEYCSVTGQELRRLKASDYPDRESLMNEIFNENLGKSVWRNGALYYLAVRMRVGGKRLLKTWNDNYEKDDQLCFPIPAC